jgi:phosphoadenosine phosphosulfate reductase
MSPTRTLDESQSEAIAVEAANRRLATMDAAARVRWALDNLPGSAALSSSFGAQAAVSLHMITCESPGIPVILVDTGYLFPETYRFVDQLTARLGLNLRVYRSELSAAWQEARHGQRWLDGTEGLDAYHRDNKLEPMQRALRELAVGTWFAGLRRDQAASRRDAPLVLRSGDLWKVHPIADWSDRDVHAYLRANDLPYHPLWHQGYLSIGDVHTTRALHEVEDPAGTRFFGLKRECGLHDPALIDAVGNSSAAERARAASRRGLRNSRPR